MKPQRFQKRKYLILFTAEALTIKSIYRQKQKDGKYNVHIHFCEKTDHYVFNVERIDWAEGLKKGDVVTLHEGNGGYYCIEKGNTVPQDGSIRACIV